MKYLYFPCRVVYFTHGKDSFLLSVDVVQLPICRIYHRSSLGFLLKRKCISKKQLCDWYAGRMWWQCKGHRAQQKTLDLSWPAVLNLLNWQYCKYSYNFLALSMERFCWSHVVSTCVQINVYMQFSLFFRFEFKRVFLSLAGRLI